ncbi:unnamed protein product [Heterobilharzia americana]|nr:unnamed protein product [Heterobilharzia americana]CAH8522565.1 unnamed protein product [Heterobilharzia americana]
MASFFELVRDAPPIEVYALTEACNEDSDCHKVNLGVGAYRTNEGTPWVLPVVRTVESLMASDQVLNKEYLPVAGMDSMCKAASKLVLGQDCELISTKRADSCQSLGGTGAVYLALQFLSRISECTTVYISNPSWPNHKGISQLVGLAVKEYRYWNSLDRGVDFSGMLDDLNNAPERAIVILHACAHNPTGTDLSRDQWLKLAHIIKAKNLFPVFDMAYQGFASGDLDNDAWAIRLFASMNMEMFVAQSFSKNFGLYNERVGNLLFITKDAITTSHVKSQVKSIIRQTWSNPPQHGARIVATVLNNPSLFNEWKTCVVIMAERVRQMRQGLYERLRKLETPGNWEHIVTQIGMFSYTGLTRTQVQYLKTKHHLYVMNDGRINMCALTTDNIDRIAEGIHDAVCNVTE